MVFHGVEDILLSKEEYYKQKAEELDLPIPEFAHEEKSVGKNISMKRTAKVLSLKLENKV